MFGYPEFSKEVFTIFDNIFSEFNFILKHESITCIEYENKFVGLRFEIDRGDLFTFIVDDNSKSYGIDKLLEIIDELEYQKYKEAINLLNGEGENRIHSELLLTRDYLSLKFGRVLSGNWGDIRDQYWKRADYFRQFMKVFTALPHSHPIRVKYQNNDESWREDLKKMLKDQGKQ